MAKNLSFLFLLLLASCVTHNDKPQLFVNLESNGNLESKNELSCIPIQQAKNNYTPADLFKSIKICIDKNKNDNAAQLIILALSYGKYDSLRVADVSAHQAVKALKIQTFRSSNQKKLDEFDVFRRANYGKATKRFVSTCNSIRKIGKPNYYPDYMISHGINAFMAGNKSGLVENFNEDNRWQEVLNNYLKCK